MRFPDISFVVQGAIDRTISPRTGKPVTQSALEALRRHYPGAEIVLSTWQGEDTTGLPCDVLLKNEDPGAYNSFRPEVGVARLDNTNRQIESSRQGLRRARGKYAVKMRSDMIFTGTSWIDFFDRYPDRVPQWKAFKQRVITCSLWARDPRCPYTSYPFHIPDWVHIGLRQDVQLLWDIPFEPQPESAQWFLTRQRTERPPLEADLRRCDVDARRYYPEQYLWLSLLRKIGPVDFPQRRDATEADIQLTELSFANNLIILDPDQFPFTNHKYEYPMRPAYRYYRFITHREWERLYLSYCADRGMLATFRNLADPAFYAKRLYNASFAPLQAFREFAAARRLATQDQTNG